MRHRDLGLNGGRASLEGCLFFSKFETADNSMYATPGLGPVSSGGGTSDTRGDCYLIAAEVVVAAWDVHAASGGTQVVMRCANRSLVCHRSAALTGS